MTVLSDEAAFELQALEVDVGDDELFFGREAFGFAQQRAVFGDQAVSGKGQVRGGFAASGRDVDVGRERAGRLLGDELPPGRDVDVGRERAGRLLGDELPQVGVFPGQFGRGREVEDHLRAVQGQLCRGRDRGPEVLADFHAELRAVDREGEVGAEVGLLSRDVDPLLGDPGPGGEPAILVEFAVVGNVTLRHNPEDLALGHDHGTVVEGRAVAQRRPDDQCQGKFARCLGEPGQGLVGRVEQRGLQQQVAACVGRHAQFGEDDDLHAAACGLLGQCRRAFHIIGAVADPQGGDRRRDLQKSEIVHLFTCLCPSRGFFPALRSFASAPNRSAEPIRPRVARGSGSPAGPCAWW